MSDGRRGGKPTSLWVLAGPALTSVAMVSQLLDDQQDTKWFSAVLLAGCLGLMVAVLVQRHIARRRDVAPAARQSGGSDRSER